VLTGCAALLALTLCTSYCAWLCGGCPPCRLGLDRQHSHQRIGLGRHYQERLAVPRALGLQVGTFAVFRPTVQVISRNGIPANGMVPQTHERREARHECGVVRGTYPGR